MPEALLIRHGRVIDPGRRLDREADVLIEDGRIAAIGNGLTGGRSIDATGKIVCPGFVDLHAHLRFPGFASKEDIVSGTAAAAAGGFTTVCAMANTQPVVDRVEVLTSVMAEVRRTASVRVFQLAAVTMGLEGREPVHMDALANAGAIAFSDDGKPVWNPSLMQQAMARAARLDKPVSVHEEDPELVLGGVANAGARSQRLRLTQWPCSGETTMVRRDVDILRHSGGHLHIAHVSCAETVEVIRTARSAGLYVTAEATPHHLVLDEGLLDGDSSSGLPPRHPCAKVNPPLRTPDDVRALVEGLSDGTIDAVATDHAPHSPRDKAGSFEQAAFGFSGFETALPLVLELVRSDSLDLITAIERLTAGPARVFGLDAGSLDIGARADVCVIDPDVAWVVTPDALRSRGKNTPFLHRRLVGRAICTVVGGEVVHDLTDLADANK